MSIKVEVDVSNQGLPYTKIIGLPGKIVQESKERIRSALKNSGFKLRAKKTTINLSPIAFSKDHAALDLAIAVGMLQCYQQLPVWENMACFGELSLDGTLRKIKGGYACAKLLQSHNITAILFPKEQEQEISLLAGKGIDLFPANNLQEIVSYYYNKRPPDKIYKPIKNEVQQTYPLLHSAALLRIVEISLAGGHHALFAGPLGTGKTLLAQTAQQIQSQLIANQIEEAALYSSIAGELNFLNVIRGKRPFFQIDSSTTMTQLLGNSERKTIGKAVLAHTGVLFADELPLFQKKLQEQLKIVIDDQSVQYSSPLGSFKLQTNFTFLATANFCSCGFLNSKRKKCVCTQADISKFQKKILPGLLDRIPIRTYITELESQTSSQQEILKQCKQKISFPQEIQRQRYSQALHKKFQSWLNGSVPPEIFITTCNFSPKGKTFLEKAVNKLIYSKRKEIQTMRISRTIADLEGAEQVQEQHIAEAMQLNRELW